MILRILAIFLSMIVAASAAYLQDSTTNSVIFERLSSVPQGWALDGVSDPSKILKFQLALKQEGAFEFEQHLLAISSPRNPKYGQLMSRDEIKAELRPSNESSSAVLGWLKSQRVPPGNIADDGEWIDFNVSISDAERMLDTKFHSFTNNATGVKIVRTLQYSVPEKLHQYVQTIIPTIQFDQVRPQRRPTGDIISLAPANNPIGLYPGKGLNVTFCNTTVTPQCLRDLYGIGNYSVSANTGDRTGITGFGNEGFQYKDYQYFTNKYAPWAVSETITDVPIGQDPQFDFDEGNLDVQYALSLSYPIPGYFYGVASNPFDPNIPFATLLLYLLHLPDDELPTTITNSWGSEERDVPENYAKLTCSLFAQLGARGVTILVASGDSGCGSDCNASDNSTGLKFNPTYPSTCPWITVVGGTYQVEPEVAWPGSSGGFSDYFARPAYQDDAVGGYLKELGIQWQGFYNPSGRGYPDVAAQAKNLVAVNNGAEYKGEGTSASAPIFAGIVALLNNARLSRKQPPLGFLNPFLYQYGYKGLTDIVDGKSTGCGEFSGAKSPIPDAGWSAAKGWDPVTGLGTPNFPTLLNLIITPAIPIPASGQLTGLNGLNYSLALGAEDV